MNNKLCEKNVESKDALMDLVIETFGLIADNIELHYENKRLRAKVKRLEAFIKGWGKDVNLLNTSSVSHKHFQKSSFWN